jgi:hypothetical protein
MLHIEMSTDALDHLGRTIPPGGRKADLQYLGEAGLALGCETGFRQEVIVGYSVRRYVEDQKSEGYDDARAIFALGAVD